MRTKNISFTYEERKWYATMLLFSDSIVNITTFDCFIGKNAIYSLSKQVQKLSFIHVYCYLATKKKHFN